MSAPSSSAAAFEAELTAEERFVLRSVIRAFGDVDDWAAVPGIRQPFEVLAVERLRVRLRAEGRTDESALNEACARLGVEPKSHESRRYRAQCTIARSA